MNGTLHARQYAGLIASLLLMACHGRAADEIPVGKPATSLDQFRLVIDASQAGRAVNRKLLGANVQWVDRGDDLLTAEGGLRPDMLALVTALHPSILRFPGGAQADTYHWERGVGPLAQRKDNEHFNAHRMQPSIMGTQEFLELCEAVGAQALITVNVASGTAAEAARWVKLINREGLTSRRTGKRLPPVKYWEVGNEPYLKDDAQPTLWMAPDEFGRRAQSFIVAMRAVDPDISIGLPVTNDERNGYPATPYPGFTARVLGAVDAPFDYLSIHNAYLPFAMERVHSKDALYWGTMAASRAVQADFQNMRELLRRVRPANHWPFALTEYNSIFTLGRGATDELVAAPIAALYVADLLLTLTQMPDVELANYWSLSGNWFFGAIRSEAQPRPAYAVLCLFDELLAGTTLTVETQTQTVNTPTVGGVGAVQGLPLLAAGATRQGNTLRVLLIHKDDTRPGRGTLHLTGAIARTARIEVLGFKDIWAVDLPVGAATVSRSDLSAGSDIAIDVPPHSVSLMTMDVQK